MNVLDLFSGVGGITHALRGLGIKTVGYCDIDQRCVDVLKKRMLDGSIDSAPVFDDVQTICADSLLPHRVDGIVGGFPCVGFSSLGLGGGVENSQTGLVRHILRLVREIKPSFVFMENVASILRYVDQVRGLALEFSDMGYEMRWVCVAAQDVGSPQRRARWYALCTLGTLPGLVVKDFVRYDWTREPHNVPRMVLGQNRSEERRFSMMGNSVVPDAVRCAFLQLWNGFECRTLTDILSKRVVPFVRNVQGGVTLGFHRRLPSCGGFVSGGFVAYDPPEPDVPRPLHLVIDPTTFRDNVGEQKIMHRWMTPRYSCPRPSCRLSDRNLRDLATQVRFEVDTDDDIREGRVNGDWVEWLMGFPLKWTT